MKNLLLFPAVANFSLFIFPFYLFNPRHLVTTLYRTRMTLIDTNGLVLHDLTIRFIRKIRVRLKENATYFPKMMLTSVVTSEMSMCPSSFKSPAVLGQLNVAVTTSESSYPSAVA